MKKRTIEVGTPIKTVRDADCPSCGFPETIDIRNPRTMKVMRQECSKRCGWFETNEAKFV